MKFFLLGFLAFYAALAVAQAQDARPPTDIYIGSYGGWNIDDVITSPFVNRQQGYVMGAVVGRNVPAVPGLYLELDVSFRQNRVEVGPLIDANHDTFAVLGNVLYQFPLDFPVRPYVLVGSGYGHTSATFEDLHILKIESAGLAYQAGFGANARVADGVTMGVGYRYLQAPQLEVLGTELSNGSNHSVVAEMRFAL